MSAIEDDDQLDSDLPIAHSDVEAEWKLLDRLHLDGWRCLPAVRVRLPLDAFYNAGARSIFEAACARYDAARLARPNTPKRWAGAITDDGLYSWLEERGRINTANGVPMLDLMQLGTNTPGELDPMVYVERILAPWPRRQALEAATFLAVQMARDIAAGDPLGALTYARDVALETFASIDGAGAAGRFTQDDWSHIEDLPAIEHAVEHVLALGTIGMTFADYGLGKTTLHDHMDLHIALGWEWFGHAVTQGHVWIIQAEGSAYIREHFLALFRRYGLTSWPPLLHTISADVPNLLREGEAAALAARIVAQTPPGERIVKVRLDTLSQTSAGGKEDNPDMARYAAMMREIMRGTGGAHVHTLHHPGWTGDHSRGGYALPAALDTIIKIEDRDGLRVVTCDARRGGKQKGGWAPFADFAYRMESEPIDDAGHTGPVIERCELPSEAASSPIAGRKRMRPSFETVWAVWCGLWREYGHTGDGVYLGRWKNACMALRDADGKPAIADPTFRGAKSFLLKAGYLTEDSNGATYPASGVLPDEVEAA